MHSFTPGHFLYAVCSVVFIVDVAGHVFEVVHVRANQHVPQLHKVAMRLVLHWGWERSKSELRYSKCAKKTFFPLMPIPSTIPQGYSLPLTLCPRASTTVLLPITANGVHSCAQRHTRVGSCQLGIFKQPYTSLSDSPSAPCRVVWTPRPRRSRIRGTGTPWSQTCQFPLVSRRSHIGRQIGIMITISNVHAVAKVPFGADVRSQDALCLWAS